MVRLPAFSCNSQNLGPQSGLEFQQLVANSYHSFCCLFPGLIPLLPSLLVPVALDLLKEESRLALRIRTVIEPHVRHVVGNVGEVG